MRLEDFPPPLPLDPLPPEGTCCGSEEAWALFWQHAGPWMFAIAIVLAMVIVGLIVDRATKARDAEEAARVEARRIAREMHGAKTLEGKIRAAESRVELVPVRWENVVARMDDGSALFVVRESEDGLRVLARPIRAEEPTLRPRRWYAKANLTLDLRADLG